MFALEIDSLVNLAYRLGCFVRVLKKHSSFYDQFAGQLSLTVSLTPIHYPYQSVRVKRFQSATSGDTRPLCYSTDSGKLVMSSGEP